MPRLTRRALNLQIRKPIKDLDKHVARILSEEHDLEHRRRPHWNCPRCKTEGKGQVKRRRERMVRSDPLPELLEKVRAKPGEWVPMRTMGSPGSACATASAYRKRVPAGFKLRYRGKEILGLYQPPSTLPATGEGVHPGDPDYEPARIAQLERDLAAAHAEISTLRARMDAAGAALRGEG